MALLDLLGRRWALRLLYELHDASPLGFADLQARAAGISPSVLATRLRELVDAGLVGVGDDGRYVPGPDEAELARILMSLDGWAKRWARRSAA
jgi:DNA-binding HxlR family transcriptional regulator